MKAGFFLSIIASLVLLAACSQFAPDKPKTAISKPTIHLTLLPQDVLTVGKPTTVLAKLNNIQERRIITNDDLETVHTQPFHLLVVDPTMTDYQHIHPEPTATPGIYSFIFTPHMAGGYRAWADVTPKATGRQEFAMADLGKPIGGGVDKTERHEATVGGYHFVLSFDKPPVKDDESMGTIRIANEKGNPVTSLEPVMGAFGHIVGFYDDFRMVVHTHPMGAEPKNPSDRGGPELMFHLAPTKTGFIKLFAQVKINGKELFVPFGVNVAAAK